MPKLETSDINNLEERLRIDLTLTDIFKNHNLEISAFSDDREGGGCHQSCYKSATLV